MNNHVSNTDAEALNVLYQSASMGALGVKNLMDTSKDQNFLSALRDQQQQYLHYEKQAGDMLHNMNEKAEDPGALKKAMSRMGTVLNTAVDSTTSHLAEMVIQGSTMGITELQSVLNSSPAVSEKTKTLCTSLLQQEQQNIDRMKSFLGKSIPS